MGEAKRRKKRLLQENPLCCLCGGKRESSTLDHIPPKAAFALRGWPYTYVYAACEECNQASSDDDTVFALVSLTFADPDSSASYPSEDAQRFVRGYQGNMPNIAKRLIDNIRYKSHRDGPYQAVKVDDEHKECLARVSRKVAKSLIYRERGQIVSYDYLVGAALFFNAEFNSLDELIENFAPFKSPSDGLIEGVENQFMYSVREIEDIGWVVLFQMHSAFASIVLICPSDKFDQLASIGHFYQSAVDEGI